MTTEAVPMRELTEAEVAMSYATNFSFIALTELVRCLKANGMLRPTQFEDAVRERLAAGDPDPGFDSRADFQMLKVLVMQLNAFAHADEQPVGPLQ